MIFGASGDLAKRKLIPALHNLAKAKLLSRDFAVIGVSTSPITDEKFREMVRKDLEDFGGTPVAPEFLAWLEPRLHCLSGDIKAPETFRRLRQAKVLNTMPDQVIAWGGALKTLRKIPSQA